MEGEGRFMDAGGTLYEGPFHRAAPRARACCARPRAGYIAGGFHLGLRDGAGHVLLPGGQEFDVVMRAGDEVSSTRPEVIADSTLGGLLPAQGGGGDAGKAQISVVTDARISLQQDIVYTHYSTGSDAAALSAGPGPARRLVGQRQDADLPYQFTRIRP